MSGSQLALLGGPFGGGAVGDPYWNNVSLLSGTTATNAGQNNTFLDSSSNAFSVTRNGNTTQGTFTPFSQADGYWSSAFNGTDGWLQIANNTAFDMGSGDFTIEGFFYQVPGGGTDQVISAKYEAGNQASWYISTTSSGTNWSIYLYWSDSTNTKIYGGAAPSVNQWHHFALQRNGNTVEFYVDGLRLTQVSTTKTMRTTTSGVAIGQTGNGYGSEWFSGYISNIRIRKGSYTYSGATYTVPTSPLTAVTNTVFLTCQSNRMVDNSTNGKRIS